MNNMGDPKQQASKPLASLSSSLLARKGDAKPAMRRQGLSSMTAPLPNAEQLQDDLGWNDMGYDVDPQPESFADESASVEDADKSENPLTGAIPEVVRQRDDLAERLKASDSAANQPNDYTPPSDKPKKKQALPPRDFSEDEEESSDIDEYVSEQPAAEMPKANASVTGITGAPVDVANSPLSVKKSVLSNGSSPENKSVATEAKASVSEPQPEPSETKRSNAAIVRKATGASGKKAKAAAKGKRAAFTLRVDPELHLRLRLACALKNVSAQQLVTQALDEFLKQIPEVDELAAHVPAKKIN